MIGYWQSMDARQVLKEVNDEARKKSVPDLILVGKWKSEEVNHLEHTFERPFDISPFELRHFGLIYDTVQPVNNLANPQHGGSHPLEFVDLHACKSARF